MLKSIPDALNPETAEILQRIPFQTAGNYLGLVAWSPLPGRQLPADANGDGLIEISDAIPILRHLFLGIPPRLPCEGGTSAEPGPGDLALLDVDGSGAIDLSDAVALLDYLFLEGRPPVLGSECVPIAGCPESCGSGSPTRVQTDAGAIGSLRTLTTVNEQFRTRFNGYAPDLSALRDAGYIDEVMGSGFKGGYRFTYVRDSPNTWSCQADPAIWHLTGGRHIFVDQSGVIRWEVEDREATAASPPIDEGIGDLISVPSSFGGGLLDLDSATGRWTERQAIAGDRAAKVLHAPGDGRLPRNVVQDRPPRSGLDAVFPHGVRRGLAPGHSEAPRMIPGLLIDLREELRDLHLSGGVSVLAQAAGGAEKKLVLPSERLAHRRVRCVDRVLELLEVIASSQHVRLVPLAIDSLPQLPQQAVDRPAELEGIDDPDPEGDGDCDRQGIEELSDQTIAQRIERLVEGGRRMVVDAAEGEEIELKVHRKHDQRHGERDEYDFHLKTRQ